MRQNHSLAVEDGRYDDAQELVEHEAGLERQLERLRTGWDRSNSPVVTADDIAEVVSMWTGVPVMQIAQEESQRLLQMEDELRKAIIGQEEAIKAISKAVRRARAGLKDPTPPDWLLHLPGPNRRRQDRADQSPGALPVRQRRSPHPAGYVRVYGTAHRQPAGRRPSWLCGL